MITSPNYAIEQSICNYLSASAVTSGSILSGSIFTTYTGIGNVDLASVPSVIVDASDTREEPYFSRNYEFTVKVYVKEMAEETNQLGVLAQKIFNEFVDSNTAKNNFSNIAYNINIWAVITSGMTPSFSGDALINEFECRCRGALVPS